MSRKKYFFTFFTVFILSILLLMGAGAGIFIVEYVLKIPVSDKMLPILTLPLVVLWVILMWMALSFPTVKRLHDTGFAGWFFLLFLLNPGYMLFYLNNLRIKEVELLTSATGFIMLLILFLKKGTEGPNKYGQDPLGTNNSPSKI